MQTETKHYVYFLRDTRNGLIKIGTTIDIPTRAKYLAWKRQSKLEYLGYIGGHYEVERQLHDQFSQFHQGNEWFAPAQEILDYIKQSANPDFPPEPPVPRYERHNLMITRDHPLYQVIADGLDIPADKRPAVFLLDYHIKIVDKPHE